MSRNTLRKFHILGQLEVSGASFQVILSLTSTGWRTASSLKGKIQTKDATSEWRLREGMSMRHNSLVHNIFSISHSFGMMIFKLFIYLLCWPCHLTALWYLTCPTRTAGCTSVWRKMTAKGGQPAQGFESVGDERVSWVRLKWYYHFVLAVLFQFTRSLVYKNGPVRIEIKVIQNFKNQLIQNFNK